MSVGCVWHLIPGSDSFGKTVPKVMVSGVPEMPTTLKCTLVEWNGRRGYLRVLVKNGRGRGTREMAQPVKDLSYKPQDLSSDPQHPCKS